MGFMDKAKAQAEKALAKGTELAKEGAAKGQELAKEGKAKLDEYQAQQAVIQQNQAASVANPPAAAPTPTTDASGAAPATPAAPASPPDADAGGQSFSLDDV